MTEPKAPAKRRRVTILGMGLTSSDWLSLVRRMDGKGLMDGEVWGINLMGALINCDRVIQMDALSEWLSSYGDPILERFKRLSCPIYTTSATPDFPSSVSYPLEQVMLKVRHSYFNNSIAYAIALLMTETDPAECELHLYGCDFGYDHPSLVGVREAGRACVEFWLSRFIQAGGLVSMPQSTTLMDANRAGILYGYEKPLEEVLPHLFADRQKPEPILDGAHEPPPPEPAPEPLPIAAE